MDDKILLEISKKLNVLISLSIKQTLGDKEFGTKEKRKQGTGDIARYLANLGLDAKTIAEINDAPHSSVRTQLKPKRRK